jgi:hypothetical protein
VKKNSAVLAALVSCALLGGATLLRAQEKDDAAREKKVRKLLQVSGELTVAKQACDQALKGQKNNPNLPPGYIKKFKELANEEFFADVFTPVYMNHFDENDVDAMIAFYETPVGKKLVKERPALQKEAMEAGASAGAKLGLKVVQELEKEKKGDDDDDAPKNKDKKKPDDGDEK